MTQTPIVLRLVIFDCDGVLFRSEAANLAFYNAVLHRVGQPPLSERGAVDCQALAAAQLFERHYGDEPGLVARLREEVHSVDYGSFYPLMHPRPRLRAVLQRLRGRYKTAMATNRGKTAREVLAHFGFADLFDLVVGVHDVSRPKPHPDMLLKCAGDLCVDPGNAVYVGDQPGDAASARAAGMHFVGMGPVLRDVERYTLEKLDQIEVVLRGLEHVCRPNGSA